jgi:micrococcal nuclease
MAFLYILLSILNFSNPFETFTARVIGISDGDTITVLYMGNRQLKIRLEGIDCPEMRQDFGQQAKQFTSALCFGKPVRVEKHGTDQYGRILAYVYVGRLCLNKELVRNGLAWRYRTNHDLEIASLESAARKRKVGLWGQPDAVAPWEFRQKAHGAFRIH